MVDYANYDFSKESKLKERLFKDVKKEYNKARLQIALSDDDLEIVVAAGANTDAEQCPFHERTCENCDKFKIGICTAGYTKDGG